MTTPHVIASSSGNHHSSSATSNGIVGSHFRVGKKIGEGSFGVVFEGEYAFPISVSALDGGDMFHVSKGLSKSAGSQEKEVLYYTH